MLLLLLTNGHAQLGLARGALGLDNSCGGSAHIHLEAELGLTLRATAFEGLFEGLC
jgi:hypothetical protein